jgi:hypothetical protein
MKPDENPEDPSPEPWETDIDAWRSESAPEPDLKPARTFEQCLAEFRRERLEELYRIHGRPTWTPIVRFPSGESRD